ncbi:TolC family outer membrane protein [Paraburkholderia sp. J76]|uniref:TolC family outer membrane protein n=1 Tax=Paraburkholderia sp. J76 TaxID=2805439 RepID=UPI002ABD449D|nr:TolC family outer membrane protein [Paraburkholderia sp. J76]
MSGPASRYTARAFALFWLLLANSAHAEDLLSVVEDALENDPALAASHDASRAVMQAVPKARAALLPHVTGGWGRAYNSISMDGIPAQHYWQNGWTVGLTQPIYNWASWTTYRQAEYQVVRARLQAASFEQDTILAVSQAYFDTLAAQDEVVRATDYLHALDEHAALIARAKAAGEATLIDVQDVEASRAQARLQLLDAQSAARLAHVALERLANRPTASLASLLPGRAPTLQPAEAEPWVTQARTHGYAVQMGEVALQIAKFDTEKARAERYPSVDVQITHTPAGAAGGYSRPTTTTTGMLSVTIPLLSGGEVSAKIEEAKALEDKARDELAVAGRDSGEGARDAWLRVTSGAARVTALEQVVQRTQAALDATRTGFRVGSRSSHDVLQATDTLYANRRDLIRARYDVVLALLKLLSQTATLDVDEIARINTQLFDAGETAVRAKPKPMSVATPASSDANLSRRAQSEPAMPLAARRTQSPGGGAPVQDPALSPHALAAAEMAPVAPALHDDYIPLSR